MTGKSVAMFVLNDMRLDSRVHREASTLAEAGHSVTVYAVLSDATVGREVEYACGYRIVRLPMLMRPMAAPAPDLTTASTSVGLRPKRMLASAFAATRPFLGGTAHVWANWRFRWRSWAARVDRVVEPADVWHAHDFNTLGVAIRCAGRFGGSVVYDSHEIFFEAAAMSALPRPVRASLRRMERRMVARADAVVTVNESVAEVLRDRLKRADVTVVRNCADLPTEPSPLRAALGLSASDRIVLYHGSLVRGRGLELLQDAMLDERLASAHLVFMGHGALRAHLEHRAHASAARDRTHFLSPVPPAELTNWVAGADVAAMPIEPTTLNHRLSSPNKLFEAIAAGVPVVGPDFVEFGRILMGGAAPLGALHAAHTPMAIADALHAVTSLADGDLAALRGRCRAAAAARWNWQHEALTLVRLYDELGRQAGSHAAPAPGVEPLPRASGMASPSASGPPGLTGRSANATAEQAK